MNWENWLGVWMIISLWAATRSPEIKGWTEVSAIVILSSFITTSLLLITWGFV